MAYNETRLSAGDVLDALNSRQRRELLRSLIAESPQTGAAITARVTGNAVRMRHCDLPKLVNYSLVEADSEHDEIALGPNIEDVRPMLELLSKHDR